MCELLGGDDRSFGVSESKVCHGPEKAHFVGGSSKSARTSSSMWRSILQNYSSSAEGGNRIKKQEAEFGAREGGLESVLKVNYDYVI